MKQYVELEQADIDEIRSGQANADLKIVALEKQFDTLKARIETHEKQFDAFKLVVASDKEKYEVRVKALESWRGSADATMVATFNATNELKSRMAAVEAEVVKLKAEDVTLKAEDVKLRAEDVAIDARLDVLEKPKAQPAPEVEAPKP